ncbi:MAG: hypothetical protein KF821_05520 [Anaerolineales bacterium]|nr:hypothetical protein [Anaerolineales bacterium]MBX3005269.1 hypothetical protein [Anaerolineales bacterium]MCW5838448.1 hypothetical protein [Anaerolineales bacterium]MCW5886940.1 hypothetical protein [Anaerolineales bacterium]
MDSQTNQDLQRIIESAQRLGVQIDEAEARQWLTAAALTSDGDDVVLDAKTGVFGHRLSMLDFSPADLEHFRKIGRLVEFMDVPGKVETALALSGSAAQSKIQTYPGDADYFERINILAATRQAACITLAELIRAKAVSTLRGPTYQLMEVKFGSYPQPVLREGRELSQGSPISWSPAELQAGQLDMQDLQGQPLLITWEQAAEQPGWCKLDWVVVDPVRKQLVNASNMLDVTWEAPDGTLTPLDGYLDPYFQEVYLEAESIPLFTKLAKQVDSNALDEYVHQLEKEVRKYVTKDRNFGKAAKRMYNIFRLTGRYGDAAFLRELFDEPATVLYQVWSLIRTIDDCFQPDSAVELSHLLAQTDQLILSVVRVLEGAEEEEIVRELLQLRDALSREHTGAPLSQRAEAARAEVINLVNNFYYARLSGVPSIKAYMDEMSSPAD